MGTFILRLPPIVEIAIGKKLLHMQKDFTLGKPIRQLIIQDDNGNRDVLVLSNFLGEVCRGKVHKKTTKGKHRIVATKAPTVAAATVATIRIARRVTRKTITNGIVVKGMGTT